MKCVAFSTALYVDISWLAARAFPECKLD